MNAVDAFAAILHLIDELSPTQRLSRWIHCRLTRASTSGVLIFRPTKAQHSAGAQREALLSGQNCQSEMQEKALLLAIGNAEPFARLQAAKCQVGGVVSNKDWSLRLTHSAHSRLQMWLEHTPGRYPVAAKEPVDPLELRIVLNHARKARIRRLHGTMGYPFQPTIPARIAELRPGKLIDNRSLRAALEV